MSSYKEIFKTSGMIGSSQIITILVGIIKTKIFALLLGPAGVGLFGMFTSISDVIRISTGFGLNVSGVKSMAQAVGENDTKLEAKIRIILIRLAIISGIIGLLVTIIFSRQLSCFTFGNYEYVSQIRILSISMLFTALTGMQTCLMQGLRKIKMMVMSSLCTCIACAIASIFLVYVWRFESIIWVIISNAIITWIINRFFFLKVKFEKIKVSLKETFQKGYEIVKLGLFLISVEIFTTIVMYLLRSYIVDNGSLDELGIFQASWTLSIQYVGLVMGALMTDYFPRLSQNIKNIPLANTLINEQSLVTLLLGSFFVALLLAFLPLVIQILYSRAFLTNILLYQLMVLGIFPRIISYPIGYLILSLGKGSMYIWFSGMFYLLFITSVYILWPYYGIISIGYGFCVSSYLALIINLLLVTKIFPLKYNKHCISLMTISFIIILGEFIIQIFTQGALKYSLTFCTLALLCTIVCDKLIKIKNHKI